MILSCIKRMGERFGVGMTAKVLKGSNDKKLHNFGFHRLTTYGILSAYTEKELTERIHFLVAERLLDIEEGRYPTLKLNQASVDVLKGKRTVTIYTAPIPTGEEADYQMDLFQRLRTLRKQLADEKGVPPYVLFSDATLKELSRYFPDTKEDMLTIKGVGEKKYEQYGEVFLDVIVKWRAENPDVKPKIRISDSVTAKPAKRKYDDAGPSHMVSFQLFQSGKSIKDIATIRELSPQTIEGHIFKAFKDGYPIAWNIFFNPDEEAAVLAAREKIDEPKLKPLREALSEDYSYTTIKAVLVKNGYM